ncbi:MAG: N-acetylmuramoyl-L-alanine amidase, partial [Phycisphaerae bacterium]|nr:N-acetylmuramoyl-L-alanine amidase [Phycisphaerae bacterium]
MHLRKLMLALVIASAALATENEPAYEKLVTEAVEGYQDPWMPIDRPLKGLVVGVDAAGGGAIEADRRRLDDLSLLTAEHLYHLLTRAGGKVVMTRTGDYRLGEDAADATARADMLRDANCDVCISIRYTNDEKSGPITVSGSEELAGHLQAASNEKMAAAVVVAASKPYACEVRFALPQDDQRPARECWDTYQANARMLYDGVALYAASREDADGKPTDEELPMGHREARRLARAIWPEGNLPAERVDWFCKQFAA